MTRISRFVVPVAGLVLAGTPAFAAGPPSDTPNRYAPAERDAAGESGHRAQAADPRAEGGLPAKANAYGRFCKDQSKRRSDAAEGTNGTPFSQCVTAMAKLASDATDSPRKACKELSREHADGEKGTPFSACVKQGAKLLREQKAQDKD